MFKRLFIYLFLAANLALVIFWWWHGSGAIVLAGGSNLTLVLGRLTGLLATFFVLLLLLFISRLPFLEKTFGLDRLVSWHHYIGFLALLFIILHPMFLIWHYMVLTGQSFLAQTWSFMFEWHDLLPAFVAEFLFLLVVITSVVIIKKKLKYEYWYLIHLLAYLAVLWSFGHQLELGHDLRFVWAALYWQIIFGLTLLTIAYYRFGKPLYNFYQQRFQVEKIVNEGPGVHSLYLTGKKLAVFKYQAGQFVIVRFLNKIFFQAHPFSVSCAPNGQFLRITVKGLGDFSNQLVEKIKVGDYVLLDGPYGIFTSKICTQPEAVCLAGGIGITPIRALIEDLLAQNKKVKLLYFARQENDLVFKAELNKLLQQNSQLIVNYILSQAPDWPGEKGNFDQDKLARLVGEVNNKDYYICGPTPMRVGVVKLLLKNQVNKTFIHFEKFSL